MNLEPKDKKTRNLFVDFRCDQIESDFTIWLVLQLVFLVIMILCSIVEPDRTLVSFCICRIIQIVVLVLIMLIAKRKKHNFVYLMPFGLLSSYLSLITICAKETNDLDSSNRTVQEYIFVLVECIQLDG